MRQTLLTSIVGVILLAVLTSSAEAVYHPTVGRWLTRDPIGYDGGNSLYEYAASKPAVGTDPQGEAVVFFGGGINIPFTGGKWNSGSLFTPPGFDSARQRIENDMPLEDAALFGHRQLEEAKTWLEKKDVLKCEIRIVGYSTGCVPALALARYVAENPGKFKGKQKALVFYDFNWGAAGMKEYYTPYLGENFHGPPGNFKKYHVVSSGRMPVVYNVFNWLKPISKWTKEVWKDIPSGVPTLGQYLWYGFDLGNTSGEWTAENKRGDGGGWLTVDERVGHDHYLLGWTVLGGPTHVMSRLFPKN